MKDKPQKINFPGRTMIARHTSTPETEAGRVPEVHGWPVLHTKLQVRMGYKVRPYLTTKQKPHGQ